MSRFAYALFHNTDLEDAALEYVNKCADVWLSMNHAPTADRDALDLLQAPWRTSQRSVEGGSAFAVNRLSAFEDHIKERNKAADVFGVKDLEQCLVYMHIARCHLVEVRRLMGRVGGIDWRFASQSSTEHLHKLDKKRSRHNWHKLAELLPGVERREEVIETLSRSHKLPKLEDMAVDRRLPKRGRKIEIAARVLGYDTFVKERTAELARAETDSDVQRKMQRDDPTFSLFKYAATDQHRAVKKLRGLPRAEVIQARKKKS